MFDLLLPPRDPLHFRKRAIEWGFALFTLGFGMWLIMPGVSMRGLAFENIRHVMAERDWALWFIFTGTSHLMSLWVNGRRDWTPFVRVGMSILAIIPYAILGGGFFLYNPVSTAVFTYWFGCCGAGLVCVYCATKDAVHAVEIRRLGNA